MHLLRMRQPRSLNQNRTSSFTCKSTTSLNIYIPSTNHPPCFCVVIQRLPKRLYNYEQEWPSHIGAKTSRKAATETNHLNKVTSCLSVELSLRLENVKMRIKHTLLTAALMALTIAMVPSLSAKADDTGFASMHDLRKFGRKLCMITHFHHGSSSSTYKTKRSAKKSAIRAWEEFTAFEYGTDWARFRRARKKGMSCSKEGGWSCSVSALPCRTYVRNY